MSAMPAKKLREPENLYSPPDDAKEKVERILAELPPEHGREFARQLIEAIALSKQEGDLRPLNEVLESWVRSWLFMTRPKFDALWDKATKAEGPRLTLADIRARRAQRAG